MLQTPLAKIIGVGKSEMEECMKNFTTEDICRIQANKYVQSVSETKIRYTDEFKEMFIEEYQKGKSPTTIFKEAGFNIVLLGSKRIERAAARWRKEFGVGVIHRGDK